MQGINSYQLPSGLSPNTQIVDIGGFAYIWDPAVGVFMNLQAVSAKFKDYDALDKFMTSNKGVTTWLRPSQST